MERRRDDVEVSAEELLDFEVPGGPITEQGLATNVSVGVRYLDAWLHGVGAAAIDNLMEDAATAEICRSQLWQWRTVAMRLDDGRVVDEAFYRAIRDEEVARLGRGAGHVPEAAQLLDDLVLAADFPEFLTLDAYRRLQ